MTIKAAIVLGPLAAATAFLLQTFGCMAVAEPPVPDENTPCGTHCTYIVRDVYPHDRAAFTQGLAYEDGYFYEGTGLNGASTLRKVNVESGEVEQQVSLDQRYFGEGIAIAGDRIVQLTWQSSVGFVYDKATFELQREFQYPTEGWGITYDGTQFIMSDGTAMLYFLDPSVFVETRRVEVTDDKGPVRELNELEYIHGEIYANVWRTDRIVRIDPATGKVKGDIDLTGILPAADRDFGTDVLNGIAYDEAGDRLFVTGKRWPKIFHIDLAAIAAK
ncbi:MAG: glutaminyl-peptide cyclotransferase [Candidatus Hydrogenedens sp.]|nr:glutaminyl-peptide cyclotransferase [Candidatus Hydrogenedens sp.]